MASVGCLMIRPFQIEDSKSICDMLMAEGIAEYQMDFVNNETWVYDDGEIRGFYTFKMEHEVFPHLQHFCVVRKSRGGNVARGLIAHFKNKVNMFHKVIINSPIHNGLTDRIVRRYFKVSTPYATDTEHKFYLVQI